MLSRAHPRDRAATTAASCRPPASPYTGMAVGFSSLKIHDEATYDFVADVVRRARGDDARVRTCTSAATRRSAPIPTTSRCSWSARPRSSPTSARSRSTWHEAGAARGHRPSTDRAVLGLHDPDRRHGREGARVRRQRRAADPLPGRRGLPRHEVRRRQPARPDVGERPDQRRARVFVGARLGHRRRRRMPTSSASRRRCGPRRSARSTTSTRWRSRASPPRPRRPGRRRPATATCAPGTSFRERVGALGPLWSSLGIRFHPSDEIPWVRRE